MRIVLADLRSDEGFVNKDTVAGGYGSRFRPFSRVTGVMCAIKRRLLAMPSVQLGYVAALCAEAGHEVVWTDGPAPWEDAHPAITIACAWCPIIPDMKWTSAAVYGRRMLSSRAFAMAAKSL